MDDVSKNKGCLANTAMDLNKKYLVTQFLLESDDAGLDKANGQSSGQHKLVGGPLEMTAGDPIGPPQTSVLQTNNMYILHVGPPIIR